MAPVLNTTAFRSDASKVANTLFDTVLGLDRAGPPRSAYHCTGCGDEVTFGSLAATWVVLR